MLLKCKCIHCFAVIKAYMRPEMEQSHSFANKGFICRQWQFYREG